MNSGGKFFIPLWLMFLFTQPIFPQPSTDLMEGTLFVNGSFTVDYSVDDLKDAKHQFVLLSDIGAGYFVVDNFSIGASFPAKWTFSKTPNGEFGLKLMGTYFFEAGGILYPYLGMSVTPGYEWRNKSFVLSSGLSFGALIGMSESVALDFGINPEVDFALTKDQKWKLTIPFGFIGVRAFF